MDISKYTQAKDVVQNLFESEKDFFVISPDGNIPQSENHKRTYMLIKESCCTAINTLLLFCEGEIAKKKNTTIKQIKTNLFVDFYSDIGQNISAYKIKSLGNVLPVLHDYIDEQIETILLPQQWFQISNLILPHPERSNIIFINRHLQNLKAILSPINWQILYPSTISRYLDRYLYISLHEDTVNLALAEIHRLWKEQPAFTLDLSSKQPWLWGIQFIHQMKNILQEKTKQFWLWNHPHNNHKSPPKESHIFTVNPNLLPTYDTLEHKLKSLQNMIDSGWINLLMKAKTIYTDIGKTYVLWSQEKALIEKNLQIIEWKLNMF